MKKVRLLIVIFAGVLLLAFLLKAIFPPGKEQAYLVKNAYPVYFSGIVEAIDNGRGLKIKLKGDPDYYNLNGVSNDTAGLADHITWGDSLSKQANSGTILLRSKANGKQSVWKLSSDSAVK